MKTFHATAALLTALLLMSFACSELENLGGQSFQDVAQRAIDPNVLPAKKDQGVILHAFYWTFDEVTEHLQEIKDAGYSGVQVGPIQRTKEPGTGYETWWLLYQPASFRTIGNFQLGTDADFREMTAAAELLGIDIIVDAVINHVADNGNQSWSPAVDQELKNSDYYHWWGEIQEYRDRNWVTQGDLGGGPDLKTQHQEVQDMVTDFLNLALEAGADGFRFDAAKHIETETGMDEFAEWKSDFWRDVLGRLMNKDIYLVGEVIPNEAANEAGYVGMMDITAHDYIWTIMNAVNNHNLRDNLKHIPTHVRTLQPEDALVYIENHDSYHRGETSWFSYQNRIYGNAILFARDKVVPRIFDRESDDLWKDPVIVEAVAFHNEMKGYTEYFSNPNDSHQLLMIERRSGTVGKGALLINLGGSISISAGTNLPAGSYVSEVDGASTFSVSAGILTGNLPNGVTILVDRGTGPLPQSPTGLSAISVQDDELTLAWDSVPEATTYRLYRSASASGTWTQVVTQAGLSFTDFGLTPGTEYFYAVSAENSNGESPLSPSLSVTTTGGSAWNSNYPSMYLRGTLNSWQTDSMSLVDHYTWEVKKELSAGESIQFKFDALGNWSTNWGDSNGDGTADPGAANISFSASVPGEYTFQFRDDTSAYDLSFSGSGDPPHAPTELSAQATGPRSILLSWNGSAGAESYVLEDSNGGYLAEVTDTTYEVLNLSPETTYSFELRAENAFGSSSTVGPVSSTTDPLGTSNTVIRVHYDTGMGNFIAVRGIQAPCHGEADSVLTGPAATSG
jgi:hypothetical protein